MVITLKEEDVVYPYQIRSLQRLKKLAEMEKENNELKEIFDSFEENYRKNEGIKHD